MRGSVKSFRKALREVFEDALAQVNEKEMPGEIEEPCDMSNPESMDMPMEAKPGLDMSLLHQTAEMLGMDVDEMMSKLGVGAEEESASRERQQASGYLGAIDGTPDYGDDMSMSSEQPEGSMDLAMGAEETDEEETEEEPEEEETEEEDVEEDDSEEETEEDDSEEETEEEDVEEEGVSQTKRSAHGYQLEQPIDYDLPGEHVKEGLNEEPSFVQNAQKMNMLKTFIGSLSPQERDALKSELPRLFGGQQVEREAEAPVSQDKAKLIMKHGEVGDKPLSDKQKSLFGMVAGNQNPSRMKK
jgi:hypothetical protein